MASMRHVPVEEARFYVGTSLRIYVRVVSVLQCTLYKALKLLSHTY